METFFGIVKRAWIVLVGIASITYAFIGFNDNVSGSIVNALILSTFPIIAGYILYRITRYIFRAY
jgi:hypothetical protein